MKTFPAATLSRFWGAWFGLMLLSIVPARAQADAHGDTAATAFNVIPTATISADLQSIADVDYFKIVLPQSVHLSAYTTGSTDTTGSLRNGSDQELFTQADNGSDINFRIEADLVAGTYFVAVSGASGSIGAYTLRIETSAFGTDDHSDTSSAATIVNANTTTTGTLNSNTDIDYFRVTLASATHLTAFTTGNADTAGSLRNGSDQEIIGNDDSAGGVNFRVENDLAAGTYYIRVAGSDGATGTYSLRVETSVVAGTLPTVTTATPVTVNATTSLLGGTVTSEGSSSVTQRGVVYGTAPNPALGGADVITIANGTGAGVFSVSSSTLAAGTVYHVRAFAINSGGTSYGTSISFSPGATSGGPDDDHGNTLATATTITANNALTASINYFADVDYLRVVVATRSLVSLLHVGAAPLIISLRDQADLEISSNESPNFTFRVQSEVQPGIYFIRLSSVNGAPGGYILSVQVDSLAIAPTVTTEAVTAITGRSASFGGIMVDDGGAPITARGIVYATTSSPTLANSTVVATGIALGSFSVNSPALAPGTRYYARAYATTLFTTAYGNEVVFTTLEDDHGDTLSSATLVNAGTTTPGILNWAGDNDYFRVTLTSPGRLGIFTTGTTNTFGSLRGVNGDELTSDDEGGSTPNFRIERDLPAGTYYARVTGTGGAVGPYSFRVITLPSVTTAAANRVGPNSVTLGGEVTSEGGNPVTQRGIVYGVQTNPTVADATTAVSGNGPGAFEVPLAALSPETRYFARAFASSAAGTTYGNQVQFTTVAETRLINLSLRSRAGTGAQTLVLGFNLTGSGAKRVLLRGIGPSLSGFDVVGFLANPTLQLRRNSTVIANNDDWGGVDAIRAAAVSAGAFALPANSRDAVLLETLSAATYSLQVGGGAGEALIEAYDVGDTSNPRFSNISARTQLEQGDVLTGGFVIAGVVPKTILIRAIGPTLGAFQLTNTMTDPKLVLYRSGVDIPIMVNNDWGGSALLSDIFSRSGAFALNPNSRDAAMLVTLEPGNYSAQISSAEGAGGIVLMEIYDAP